MRNKKRKLNEARKFISIWCNNEDKMELLKSTQSLSIKRNTVTIKSHKKGAWYGIKGETMNRLMDYLTHKLDWDIDLQIEGGDVWKQR